MNDNDELRKAELLEAIEAADALINIHKYNKVDQYFTDTGPNARSRYPKQMELMKASKLFRICAFIGGNGTGKTVWSSVNAYFHASGKYPEWWEGHRFNYPLDICIVSKDSKSLRDGIQKILFGGIGDDDIGTGIIRREDMLDHRDKLQVWAFAGPGNCIGQVRIKHVTNGVSDGWSVISFMTYEQGWMAFQGSNRDFIIFDEEPDDGKILAECLARLRGGDGKPAGRFLASFTPTAGQRDTYLYFVRHNQFPVDGIVYDDQGNPDRYVVRVDWDYSPHLSEEWKRSSIAAWKLLDPNNIDARKSGIASIGSGLVYPLSDDQIVVRSRPIPSYWKKALGMDPGLCNFAVVWLAKDPNTGIIYVYDEYQTSHHTLYLIHAEAIKARGEWIHGGIDPHEAVKPRDTGETVHSYFESLGINLVEAKGDPNTVRVKIRTMLESGTLKIFDSCINLLNQRRTYRFDDKDSNKIAKGQDDHLLDALLYAICVFDDVCQSYADLQDYEREIKQKNISQIQTNPTRNPFTGY